MGAGQLAGAVLGSPVAAAWQMDGVLIVTGMLALVAMIAVLTMPRPVSVPSVPELS